MKNSITSLDLCLQGIHSVGIAGHVRPDGDCVGSTLAVYNYICDNYPDIEVKLFLESLPPVFSFLKRSNEILSDYSADECFDLFIAEDCSDLSRLGAAAKYFSGAKHTLCIDHHISNEAFADDNYIFPQASSASELVFELLDETRISKEIAECLYTGIIHDTGVFQYSCTSAKTMKVGGLLMDMGIDYPRIVDETFYTKTYVQNQLLGQALINSRLYLDGRVILTTLSCREMEALHGGPADTNGVVNQIRITKGTLVAVFLYENGDGTYKGSLRVNSEIDVAKVAAAFGGGGHVKAAGFTIEGPLESAIDRILEEIAKQL